MINKTFGATFIIAGSTIGAGMLGLPVVMGLFGFIPSMIVMVMVWGYMLSTAFMLLEANSWLKRDTPVNLISLSHLTLGKVGGGVVWVTYGFLFYSLMVAYIIKSGDLLRALDSNSFIGVDESYLIIAFCCFLVIWRGAKVVDIFNQLFMFGLIVAYITLIYAIAPGMDVSLLDDVHSYDYIFLVPFIIIAFGFHNMIPSVYEYLERDTNKTKAAIVYGSFIPMFLYIIWVVVSLGVLDFQEVSSGFKENKIATELMGDLATSPIIAIGAISFSFFAIITSLLGQGLSLRDFIIDGMSLIGVNLSKFVASIACIFPALIFAYTWPEIFFQCLQIAGGVAATLLFGILPPVILMRGRYKYSMKGDYKMTFNKPGLVIIAFFSTLIFIYEAYQTFI